MLMLIFCRRFSPLFDYAADVVLFAARCAMRHFRALSRFT
jgi:hypothetical protein